MSNENFKEHCASCKASIFPVNRCHCGVCGKPSRARMVDMVDAAMVEMSNISPPLKRSECERLIGAAIESTISPVQESAVSQGWELVRTPITEEMHVAAVKVLHRAPGLAGLPQRMLDAMIEAAPAPAVPVNSRELFEHTMAVKVGWCSKDFERSHHLGDYLYQYTIAAWLAWQAGSSVLTQAPGWISVADRLPDSEHGNPPIEFYNNDMRNPTRQVIGIYRAGVWYSGGLQFCNVTHWKPLTPAPVCDAGGDA